MTSNQRHPEAEARIIKLYSEFPTQVIRVLSYTGDNTFINSIVNNFEQFGRMTVRQMYSCITVMKQLNGESVYSRPCAELKALRIDRLTREVRRLTRENAELRQRVILL